MQRADCSAPLQPSRGASVDEYECLQNETSYETTNYFVFCLCVISLLLSSLATTTTTTFNNYSLTAIKQANTTPR